MIPVSLQLKNFLSYGEDVPPLDFREFDVACLSGNNGHGKSAILDAMTWAIWGEARKAAGEKSPADGLVRIGTSEMQVELEFDLDRDRYRVIRNYQRRSRRTRLDFQVFDETTHSYKSLTEKTSRATQEKINSTLRMNYDTFINSAFILQGRVDEFTKKTPHQRKQILAEILDLSRYERLAELAKDHHRETKSQCSMFEAQLKGIDEELAHKKEYEQKLAELDQQIVAINEKRQHFETQQQTLEKQLAELQGKQIQLEDRKRQQKELSENLNRIEERIARQQKQITDVQAILEREQEILEQYNRYLELQNRNKTYEEKLQQKTGYQTQKAELDQKIQHIRHGFEKELEKQQAAQTQIQKTLKDVQPLLQKEQEIEQGYQELQTARKQDEHLEEARSEVESLERSLREIEKRIEQQKSQLTVDLQSRQRHMSELQALAKQQAAREKELQKYKDAVAQLEALEKEREQNKEIGMECRSQLDGLKNQQNRFQENIQEIKEKLDLLKRSDTPQCPVCKSNLDGHKKEELEEHFRQDVQKIQDEERLIVQQIQEHETRLEDLRKQYKKLEQQIKKHQRSREQLIQAENALQESRKAASQLVELEQQVSAFQTQIEKKDYAQEEHARLAELQKNIETLAYNSKEHQALKKRLKTLQKFEREYTKLEGARERHRDARASLPAIEQELARIRTVLDQQDYAHSEQAQLQELLTKIAELGYDEQAHKHVRQELLRLQEAPQQKFKLDDAHERIGPLEQELEEIVADQQKHSENLADLEQQIGTLEAELKHLPTVRQRCEDVNTTLQTMGKERDELLQTYGTYQNKHERCEQLEVEREQKQQEQKQAGKDRDMYGRLIQIFGKDGMQAYLIANAIPEIEHETNEILARLTDNRTHIAIEQVKDLQGGRTKETLDIKISDELGTRSYELYSGGEAFRVDFAIRIALSKLLANRAGTKLKTLVIDEGFGTQDTHGLEQLVEAIQAISMDFEKILVITHLESLKNAFPVRIEVVKLPDIGSQYQIVH